VQIVTWHNWLDQHIPYYEKERQQNCFLNDPPDSVLVVDPVDRNRLVGVKGFTNWEAMDNRINDLGYQTKAIFLDNDTHQRWYWAFWNQHEALIAVMRLS
jgi:hypothetical protein